MALRQPGPGRGGKAVNRPEPAGAPPEPRWDGRRILFEVEHEGAAVACAISPDALRDLSGTRCFRPADMLRCFSAERGRIEAMAAVKLRARPGRVAGLLTLWSDDVDAPRPAGADGRSGGI